MRCPAEERPYRPRGAAVAILLCLFGSVAGAAHASPQTAGSEPQYVASLRPNTVAIEAEGRLGFGFVVGVGIHEMIVATARHTIQPPGGLPAREANVCFDGPGCFPGELVYLADPVGSEPGLDLAFLSVPYVEMLEWRPDAFGDTPSIGSPVWVIGRAQEWYVPQSPGELVAIAPDSSLVHYERLEVASGVSGAPVVSADGIIALHTLSSGALASGVQIAQVRSRFDDLDGVAWILVPRPACEDRSSERGVLEGRPITVRFDPTRPEAALEAMARLNCVGALAYPRPVWPTDPWPEDGVAYAGGDLRAARAIQSLLAPLGRLDARLEETEVGLEVRIR